MSRLPKLKIALIASLLALVSPGMAQAKDPIFLGTEEFEAAEAMLKITLDEGRNALQTYLEENDESYYAFPEEIIMVHKGGYLFMQGDFHLHIRYVGYHVDENGIVSKVDLKESISIKEYMKLIGRNSWGSWL